jgi:Phage integrase family
VVDGTPTSWVSLHTFRHTCASIMFRRGWNPSQVQRFLGHHSPSFTLDVYVHPLDEDVPTPTFFDTLEAETLGNERATKATETGRNDQAGDAGQAAL